MKFIRFSFIFATLLVFVLAEVGCSAETDSDNRTVPNYAAVADGSGGASASVVSFDPPSGGSINPGVDTRSSGGTSVFVEEVCADVIV